MERVDERGDERTKKGSVAEVERWRAPRGGYAMEGIGRVGDDTEMTDVKGGGETGRRNVSRERKGRGRGRGGRARRDGHFFGSGWMDTVEGKPTRRAA